METDTSLRPLHVRGMKGPPKKETGLNYLEVCEQKGRSHMCKNHLMGLKQAVPALARPCNWKHPFSPLYNLVRLSQSSHHCPQCNVSTCLSVAGVFL